MNIKLEQHKLFPFVALSLVLSFALFVGYIAYVAAQEITAIETTTVVIN